MERLYKLAKLQMLQALKGEKKKHFWFKLQENILPGLTPFVVDVHVTCSAILRWRCLPWHSHLAGLFWTCR